jgi:hypothetical protein
MMLPAICDRCHAFFPSGYDVQGGTFHLANNVAGPCPHCGAMGHVPDGTFKIIGNTIELLSGPARTRSELQHFARILRDARERGADLEEVRREVRKQVPELASLADLLPRTPGDLYAFLTLIVTIIALVLSQMDKGSKETIEIHQVVNQIVHVQGPAPSKPQPSAPPRRAQSKPQPSATPKPAKPGRNSPCPCGSGKKHKRCCLLTR